MKLPEIKIIDFQKPDSYTDRGRYSVTVDGVRVLSGNTEIEALQKALAWNSYYMEEYKVKYYELCKLCSPIANFIKPDEDDF